MWTKLFWRQAAERAIKTFAGTFAAALGAGEMGVIEANWQSAASIAAMATVLSVLGSIASTGVGNIESASLVLEPKNTYKRSPL